MTRLFHTLIVSSSALLVGGLGCGASAVLPFDGSSPIVDSATAPDAAVDAATAPDVMADTSLPPQPDIQDVPNDTQDVQPDVVDVVGDRRCIEEGWPTTKGMFCREFDAGTTRCCRGVDETEHCQTFIVHPDGCREPIEGN